MYEQRFTPLDDGSTFTGYDVVVCAACGHGYADRVPSQDFYDRYYREMTKYGSFRPVNAVDASHPNYADVVSALERYFPDRSVRVLDIGTGSGHLLGAFRAAGYENLLGIDPAAQCAADAAERYGVRVVATPISHMAFGGERFDLVILGSVIEHLRDAVPSLEEAASVVAPGGAIFIDAPDAERFAAFPGAPFQQFSLEHINYFAAPSLVNVFRRIGYEPVDVWHDVRHDGPVAEPALCGLFRESRAAGEIVRDDVTEPALRAYVAASRAAEAELARPIAGLRRTREPVIVWGVGTLTLRLLTTETFRELNVVAFVDSNRNYQGKRVGGIPILAPAELRGRAETIVVSSRAHQGEIVAQIRQDLRLGNPVVTLFAEDGAAA